MKEELLHYVWKHGFYRTGNLKDTEGNPVVVLSPGEYNRDSGPDFFNARLRIDNTEWAGNVEIHVKSSHFEAHGHHRDHAFDNIIMHVVAEFDKHVRNARGKEVPTLVVEPDRNVEEKYASLMNAPYTIACQDNLRNTDNLLIRMWLHALVIERLKGKSESVNGIYSETGNDWEETFYRIICRYFGFRVNAEPFELLAKSIPFRIIRKHSDNLFQVEALLFGTAGMLEEGIFRNAIEDEYYLGLLKEFRVLSAKYSLKPLHGWIWKFNRLRPVNFPTIRISQLSAMISSAGGLFSKVIGAQSLKELKSFFEVSASAYWDDHFVFGRKAGILKKKAGKTASDILLINAVIPVLFSYGIMRDCHEITERAVSFLDEVKPENNVIVDEWREAGIDAVSASDTQALIQLRNLYCRRRRCLECRIGSRMISGGAVLKKPEELLLEPP